MTHFYSGQTIDSRYRLKQHIGSGSFGEVWLTDDTMSELEVVLKIYANLDDEGIKLFRHEYASTFSLSHPNLLCPQHFGAEGRTAYLVLPYCPKGSTRHLSGHMAPDQLRKFIIQVASALSYLHSHRPPVIHRDIKPDNVLIDADDNFRLSDFGVSLELRSTILTATMKMTSAGSVPYMAPEMFDSNPRQSAASDIWSLGATIYQLATGNLPFMGNGGGMQRSGAAIPALPPKYPADINRLMQACLALNPDDRPTAAMIASGQWPGADDRTVILPPRTPEPHADPDEGNSTGTPGWVYPVIISLIAAIAIGAYLIISNTGRLANAPVDQPAPGLVEDDTVIVEETTVVEEADPDTVIETTPPKLGSNVESGELSAIRNASVKTIMLDGHPMRYLSIMTYHGIDGNGDHVFTAPQGITLKTQRVADFSNSMLKQWIGNTYGSFKNGHKPTLMLDKDNLLVISDYTPSGDIFYIRGVERDGWTYIAELNWPKRLQSAFGPRVAELLNGFPD